MGLGIGLGAFASGLESGYDFGTKLQSDIKKRRHEEALQSALQQGATEYEGAVASGSAQPNDPNGILRYAYPKMMKAAQDAGDVGEMQKISEWIKSDNAKQGTSLFASGMLKGQNGDMVGALNDFLAAGKIQGFGNYQVSDPKPLEGGGISVTITDPSTGKSTIQQFKTPDDVLSFGATYFNPESQFKQWQETQAAKSQYSRDVAKAGDIERAKGTAKIENDMVKQNLGLGGDDMMKARKQALDELKESQEFANADANTQRAMIEGRARELLGANQTGIGAPKKRVILSTKTGQLVTE